MGTYIIKFVKAELEELWHEFWDLAEPTERAKLANRDASLGQTDIVKAKNKAEACRVWAENNPGYVVIVDATAKLD